MSKRNLKGIALLAGCLAVFLIVLGLFMFKGGEEGLPLARFAEAPLAIITKDGKKMEFHVEIAEQPDQLAQGLMYRDHLAENRGMLFIYPKIDQATMWMQNTKIPLDILFIDEKGIIVHIAANNRPYDTRQIPSVQMVRASLEINGGFAARLGITTGDRVENRRLQEASRFAP